MHARFMMNFTTCTARRLRVGLRMSWPRGAPVPNALDESLLSRFRNDTERLIDRPAEVERFGIAVSGGPDSMALLALAHATYPGQVEAATVNHGFRTEAAEEAAMVDRKSTRLNSSHYCESR